MRSESISRSWWIGIAAVIAILGLGGCASEKSRTVDTPTVTSAGTSYAGERQPISIGRFTNNSPYMRGLFSEGDDRLGNQARTILKTHLSNTNRFRVLDRENLSMIEQENQLSGVSSQIQGASVLLTGQVTEFGRRTTGDKQLFGILGRGKKQLAYSKVSINVVDTRTTEVIHSVQGAGEYTLSNREVLGFGSTAEYDATLNGKVLNLSITDAVNKLVSDLESGKWNAGDDRG